MTEHRATTLQTRLDQLRTAARDRPQSLQSTLQWYSPAAAGYKTSEVRFQLSTEALTARVAGAAVNLAAPVRLAPTQIAKPWGKEIWVTGMEARGEAAVSVGGQQLPLPLYLALAPQWLHQQQPIVLLKILDPKPEPVVGDLYFEVHERKQETYIVTAIDQGAWPDGAGAIRFGVAQELRQHYNDDAAFRGAYLNAVQAYERVRRVLDAQLDPHECGDPELQAANTPEALGALERKRRAQMEAFTSLLTLRVGDIVSVPPWQPHALQHGVQVVEFQTPTYERYIISFAQKVLTQAHWDSERAIANMSLEPMDLAADVAAESAEGITRIARYSDFGALRVRLTNAASETQAYTLPSNIPYAIAICISGSIDCAGITLEPGQACFVPSLCVLTGARIQARNAEALMLIAAPEL